MASSEKREYKSEAIAKRQLVQWQKKGCRVTRRKNAPVHPEDLAEGKGGQGSGDAHDRPVKARPEILIARPVKDHFASHILFQYNYK